MDITIRPAVMPMRVLKRGLALLVPKLKWKGRILILLLVLACGVAIIDTIWLRSEAFEALVRIDPLPRTRELVAQERYAEAHEYLDFFMDYDYVRTNPDAVLLYQEIGAHRRKVRYRLGKVTEGIMWGASDELEGQISAVASDFFVIGDVRDLTLEGIKWAHGEDVDEFTAALSAIGIAASAGSWLTAGGTLSAKPGLSFLKAAKKVDNVPTWAQKELIRSAKLLKQSKRLDTATDLLDTLHDLLKTSGVKGTLKALDSAEDLKSLKKIATFSKTFGKKSATLLELTGDTGLTVFKQIDTVPKSLFLEAATYGKPGIQTLRQVGPDAFRRFLRFSKITVRTTKVAYKHHEVLLNWSWKAISLSLGRLPLWALSAIIGYGFLLLIRR
jgi:hypothetical protein